jgi:hypothetical protein
MVHIVFIAFAIGIGNSIETTIDTDTDPENDYAGCICLS